MPYQFRLKFSNKFQNKVFIWGSNAVFTVIFIQLSVETKICLTNTNLLIQDKVKLISPSPTGSGQNNINYLYTEVHNGSIPSQLWQG